MKIQILISILYLSILTSAIAQEHTDIFSDIDQAYKSFRYDDVIHGCQKLLGDSAMARTGQLPEIYRYMALAYYALGEMGPSYGKFYQLLLADPQYQLDPVTTPPKILRFFNEIKSTLPPLNTDTVSAQKDTLYIFKGPEHQSILYSFILPGTGHLREGFKTKGWLITSGAALTLASSVYFIFETNRREKEYLNAVDKDIIEQKYSDYNESYRLRNISIGLYAAIWLYAQIDLLLISEKKVPQTSGMTLGPTMLDSYTPALSVSYQF